jgi:signal transduction histidine kinase
VISFATPPLSQYAIRSLDGVTAPDSAENRLIAARFVSIFAIAAAALGMVIGTAALVTHEPYTEHPVAVLFIAGFVGVATLTQAHLVRHRLPIWWLHLTCGIGEVAVIFGGFVIGSRSSYLLVTAAYAIFFGGIAIAFTFRGVLIHYCIDVAGIAVVFAAQGHPGLLGEIWSVATSMAIVAGVVYWFLGLTERRSESDRIARAELEVVSNRQSAFLANMSHELRTPLNAIIGFSELLAGGVAGELNQRQAEYVDDVQSSGKHLLALIDDVLDLAKVEEGRTELLLGTVDVANLVAAGAALFREQAGRHDIVLETPVAPDVGTIEADERKLKQVVFNLLSNAVRHAPAGGRVELGARRAGSWIEIWVTDNGPGIAPEQHEQIFEEYHQVSDAAVDRQPGTGLGLALVRRFVERHGGEIGVVSALGQGATFRVRLPDVASPDADEDVPTHAVTSWRSHFGVRSVEGDGPPDSQENRHRIAQLVTAVTLGGVGMLLVGQLLFIPFVHDAQYHPLGVTATALFGLAAALVFRTNAYRIPLRLATPISMTATIGVTIGSYFAGPNHAEVVFGYVVFGISAWAVFRVGTAIIQTAFIGFCYAFLLWYQAGNFDPVGRWLIIVPCITMVSLLVLWLVGKIARLAASEREAKAQLEIVSRHKSEFLANMSHELRTPLNAIIGFSEVLRDELFGPLSPKQTEYVEDILIAGRHLLAVINDILDLAKLEAGRMPTDARQISLAPLLEAVARKRELGVSVPAEASVVGDEAQVLQLLDNLVTASPGAERLDVDVDNGFVRVRVERDGPPLFVDDERAFEEFHRGERVGGTGLELPLARALATLHQGRVEVADARQLAVVLPRAE